MNDKPIVETLLNALVEEISYTLKKSQSFQMPYPIVLQHQASSWNHQRTTPQQEAKKNGYGPFSVPISESSVEANRSDGTIIQGNESLSKVRSWNWCNLIANCRSCSEAISKTSLAALIAKIKSTHTTSYSRSKLSKIRSFRALWIDPLNPSLSTPPLYIQLELMSLAIFQYVRQQPIHKHLDTYPKSVAVIIPVLLFLRLH